MLTSGLPRTVETARIVAPDIEPESWPELREIQGGALEASNVNLTEQLVNMITAQRNFQANAQMIQAQDQLTQTVINIR